MRNTEFNKLIDRYLKNELRSEEKQKVENWLDYLADENAFDQLSDAEKLESENKIYDQLAKRIKLPAEAAKPALIVQLKPLLKIASSVALFGILLCCFRVKLKEVFNINQTASVVNVKGHITKSILSDGSIVWLKGNSKLYFPLKFGGDLRKVDLEGEALFEVAKDAAHPFVIHCGTLTTRVLGTSFNIKRTRNQVEVNVLTGRVFLSSKSYGAVTLHPHQKAVYSELKKTIVKGVQPALEVAAITKGTEYNMYFNDARVGDVLQRIEKKFEVAISVKDSKLNNSLITADFTDQSLVNTMNIMSEALNLDFEIDGQSVVLKNKAITNEILN